MVNSLETGGVSTAWPRSGQCISAARRGCLAHRRPDRAAEHRAAAGDVDPVVDARADRVTRRVIGAPPPGIAAGS
jgi:hypothetical protein